MYMYMMCMCMRICRCVGICLWAVYMCMPMCVYTDVQVYMSTCRERCIRNLAPQRSIFGTIIFPLSPKKHAFSQGLLSSLVQDMAWIAAASLFSGTALGFLSSWRCLDRFVRVRHVGCFKMLSASVQVLLHGIEAVVVLTLIILT